jgi:preprotein translocase subunit SecG
MIVSSMLAVGFAMKLVAVLWFLSALVLVLIVLIQKGKGGGLSGALGGGMAGGLLGSKTGDFLTWATVSVVAVFLALSVVMAKWYKPSISEVDQPAVQQAPAESQQPVTLPTATESEAAAEKAKDAAEAALPAEVNKP